MNRQRCVYSADLEDRCACWSRYEVIDRYALSGEGAAFDAAGSDARLKQNTLFALTKSYIDSNTPISGPGNEANSDFVSSGFGVGVVGRDPGVSTPSPIVLNVEPNDQASGISSWIATYASLMS
jgi:hypothetical protein